MVPMEIRDSEGVPFASLESLWPGINLDMFYLLFIFLFLY